MVPSITLQMPVWLGSDIVSACLFIVSALFVHWAGPFVDAHPQRAQPNEQRTWTTSPHFLYSTHKSKAVSRVFCCKLTIRDMNATHAQSPIILSNHTHFYHKLIVNFCHLFLSPPEEGTWVNLASENKNKQSLKR